MFNFKISLLLLYGAVVLTSCATYQQHVQNARDQLQGGHFDQAVDGLRLLAEKEDGDQLAYLLDYGMALHIAGRYQESIEVFLRADRLADQMDYHSVSRIAGATLLNEEMVQYKGDPYEKIFINAYIALNFLCLGKLDDALVEARRINEKILKYNSEKKASFEKNSFGKYLSALVWEADRKWDDAYIAFEEAYSIDPGIPTIGEDLIRSARRAQRMDSYQKWKKIFTDIKESPEWYDRKLGEVIVLVQQGWGPRKYAEHGQLNPYLLPVHSETTKVAVTLSTVDNDKLEGSRPRENKSVMVYNVTQDAIKTLRADAGSLVARRVGARIAKEIVADQIRQKDEALGLLAWLIMVFSERADLRQWSTLPNSMHVVRFFVPPGKYNVLIKGLNNYDNMTGEVFNKDVEVKAPGRKAFTIIRTIR